MVHHFALGRRQLVVLASGVALSGLLVFLGGLLLGVSFAIGPAEVSSGSPEPVATAAADGAPSAPVTAGKPAEPSTETPTGGAAAVVAAAPAEDLVGIGSGRRVERGPLLPKPETIYELQLDAYLSPEEAQPMVAMLTDRGYPAYVVESHPSSGRSLQTVRLGTWPTMEEAAIAAAELRDNERLDAVIRFRPKPPENARPAAVPAPAEPPSRTAPEGSAPADGPAGAPATDGGAG